MNDQSAKHAGPQLSLGDAVSIMVGIIVGATIYESPPFIFSNVHSFASGLAVWALVGVLSLIGALCYAELATTYPTAGGDYTYLTRAYGPGMGFLFAWAELAIIRTGGSIAAMAYVFANYANQLMPLRAAEATGPPAFFERPGLVYAGGSVLVLTLVNALGLKPGKFIQNLLTSAKVLGLLAIIFTGFFFFLWPRTAEDVIPQGRDAMPGASFALAMVIVFYAYGGWNECAYVAAELQDRRRTIVRALIYGVGLVTVIYVAINASFLLALGLDRARASGAVAADVMRLPLGEAGAKMISILIMVSALGAINGLLFTGVRLYATFGSEERVFAWLAKPGPFSRVPLGSLLAQAVFSLAIICLFEFGPYWKPVVADWAKAIGIDVPETFVTRPAQGFIDIVACAAPVFWLFFLMSGYSVLVLRSRDPYRERPFRAPLGPLLPMIFCASSLYMLYRSATYAYSQGPLAEATVVVFFMLLGVPLYALSGSNEPPPVESGNAA